MSDCCEKNRAPVKARCPASDTLGRPVGQDTLESLLVAQAVGRVLPEVSYCFCPEATCAIVYFSAAGDQTFTTAEVTVPVWQKAPTDPNVPVCYCFKHTPGSIALELDSSGRSTTVADISAKMKAGLCDCEHNNPQGSCCLGNVNTAVNAIKREHASAASV